MTETKNPQTKCNPLKVLWLAFRENWFLLGFAIVLTVASGFSWYCQLNPIVPKVAVGIVDLYLLLVLFASAVRSDGENGNLEKKFYEHFWFELFPIRTAGLIMVGLFFVTIVFSFAALYQAADGGFQKGNDANASLKLFDSLYVSTVATIGYGSITPSHETTKRLLMFEVVSNLLLLVAIVSFLISRISGFGNKNKATETQLELSPTAENIIAVMRWLKDADLLKQEEKTKIRDAANDMVNDATNNSQ